MSRFLLIPALLAALFAASVVGCRREEAPPSGEVVLDFWNGFSGPDGAQMEALVQEFNALHKGRIRVKMQIIPWGTYYDKVTLGLAFGGAPEVLVLHVNRFPEYASHGVLESLEGHFAASGLKKEDFLPQAWSASQWQGDLQALPLDCHPLGLYYNLDLFREAGISRPPEDYQEFMEAAKKLTKDENGDGRPEQWGFAFTWLKSNTTCFLNQHGASLLSDDLSESGLSTPEARRAVDQMLEIINSGVAPRPEGQDAWLGFQTGKVAMALEGVYMMAGLKEQKNLRWAAAPVPQFGPKRAVWAGSHLLAIPKGLDERVQEAGWTFVKFLSDSSIEWAKGGQCPARLSLLESPAFKALPVQSQFARQLDAVVYEPASVQFNLVATFGDSAYEAILNEISPPGEALALATRRINNRLSPP
jgi:multiple sugar transport system substrate-binding protein